MRSLTTRAAVLAASTAILLAMAAVPVSATELTHACTNHDDGYTVRLPDGWYHNERVEGGQLDDVAACRFFSPSDFEIRPATDAAGIAISISREASAPSAEDMETEVGGRPAVVLETTAGEGGFEPPGTRHYQYWIDMGDDWLVAGTSDGPNYVGDYAANIEVLQAMMDTLTFGTGTLPDTAMGSWGGGWLGLAAGIILVALGFIAGRATSSR